MKSLKFGCIVRNSTSIVDIKFDIDDYYFDCCMEKFFNHELDCCYSNDYFV